MPDQSDLERTLVNDPSAPARNETLDATVMTAGDSVPEATSQPPVRKPAMNAKTTDKETGGLPSVFGDFKMIRKLGQGGMGEVWLGHQVSLDRPAAIKLLAKHLADKPDFVKRFYREARAMAKVDHPNAVRVYAVDEVDRVHYVAMEFIDGKSMQNWLEKLGRLNVADALHVTLRCAEALEHAHRLNMIHRDIKPDNIMLTSRGVVKVSDFGLAKALDDEEMSMTQSGTGLGTPYYMAPEQARNAKHVDGRSDIYALGATLYHFLTGKLPFTGDSLIELVKAKEAGRFTPSRRINAEVPERLDLIIDKMLAKDPDSRFKDFGEVIKILSGLGIAGPSLSFIDAPDKVVVATTSAAAAPAARTAAGKSGVPAAGKSTPPAAASKSNSATSVEPTWFIAFRTPEGKETINRWSTPQILQALRAGTIDHKAKVKKTANDAFVPIAQYPEFEAAVQSRIAKQKADKKAGDMKAMYAKLDKEERWRKTMRWLQGLMTNTMGFLGLIVYLLVIVGVLGGAYVGWKMYGDQILAKIKAPPTATSPTPPANTSGSTGQ